MNKKETILLRLSHWSSIRALPNATLGRLFRALYHEQLGLEPVDLSNDDKASMAFSFMRSQIQYDADKYKKVCESHAEAALQSGEACRNKTLNEQMLIMHSNAEQNEQLFTSLTKTNKMNYNDNEYVYENEKGEKEMMVYDDSNINMQIVFDLVYPLFFFRNLAKPKEETEAFIQYYDANDWTLEHGKKLRTKKDILYRANKWRPKSQDNKPYRVDSEWLVIWEKVYDQSRKMGAPPEVINAMLCPSIRTKIENSSLFLITPHLADDFLLIHYSEFKPLFDEMLKISIYKNKVKEIKFVAMEKINNE